MTEKKKEPGEPMSASHPRVSREQDDHDGTELEREARHLATYAASINWQPGDNTREWLLGLRDLIEHVQALTEPLEGEMCSDLDLSHLDDDDCDDGPRCESCDEPATHKTSDDVDMCGECYQVLCDEQGVTGEGR
jgi:hypothetical protein